MFIVFVLAGQMYVQDEHRMDEVIVRQMSLMVRAIDRPFFLFSSLVDDYLLSLLYLCFFWTGQCHGTLHTSCRYTVRLCRCWHAAIACSRAPINTPSAENPSSLDCLSSLLSSLLVYRLCCCIERSVLFAARSRLYALASTNRSKMFRFYSRVECLFLFFNYPR